MDTRTLTKGIADSDWARIAKLANTTPDQIRSAYESALTGHPENLRVKSFTRGNPIKSGDSIRVNFDIGLYKTLSLDGYVEFSGTSSTDWSAAFHVCLELAGNSVWCTDETLTPSNAQICYHPDLAAVKADLCFAIQGSNLCFNVSGDACYWAFGWHCGNFNETVHCFG